ncbi:MAG: hypothetical protein HZB81_03740 [Deltaproteobacteria bacterium]|nr:hypothetical protein [Deltaproteobacteria bacterium]
MNNHYISKSQFMRGLQCHKSLWLYKNKPGLRTEPDESTQFGSGRGSQAEGQVYFLAISLVPKLQLGRAGLFTKQS